MLARKIADLTFVGLARVARRHSVVWIQNLISTRTRPIRSDRVEIDGVAERPAGTR